MFCPRGERQSGERGCNASSSPRDHLYPAPIAQAEVVEAATTSMVIAEPLKSLNSKAPPIFVPRQNQGREDFHFDPAFATLDVKWTIWPGKECGSCNVHLTRTEQQHNIWQTCIHGMQMLLHFGGSGLQSPPVTFISPTISGRLGWF